MSREFITGFIRNRVAVLFMIVSILLRCSTTFGLLWYERELVAYTGLKQVFVACVVDTGVKTGTQACIDNTVKRGGEKGLSESVPYMCKLGECKNERNRGAKSP